MRTERNGHYVGMFRYAGTDVRRDVLSRLRRIISEENRSHAHWRVRRKVILRDVSPAVAAEQLRKIRDEGSLFTSNQRNELVRRGKSELSTGVVRLFTKKIVLAVVREIELHSVPTFTLTLAPSNNLPVISSELWLRNLQLTVGGYIEVSHGGRRAVARICRVLDVTNDEQGREKV